MKEKRTGQRKNNEKAVTQDRYQKWIAENEKSSGKRSRTASGRKLSGENGEGDFPALLFVLVSDGAGAGRDSFPAGRRLRSWIRQDRENKLFLGEWVCGKQIAQLWQLLADSRADYVIFLTQGDLCAQNGWTRLRLPCVASTEKAEYGGGSRQGYPAMIYGDEDWLSLRGKQRSAPFFKPDWSPELLLELRYTGQACAYRRELSLEVLADMAESEASVLPLGADSGENFWEKGMQELFLYDFVLRFTEKIKGEEILHLPHILNHRIRERLERLSAEEQQRIDRMKLALLRRRGIRGRIEPVADMPLSRVVYEPVRMPKVSIVIPSKDNVGLLTACLDSLRQNTGYDNWEVILVDNGSSPENRERVDAYCRKHAIQYVYEPMPFNFARMCNLGAERAGGEVLLFLNDDIEVIQEDWLERMLGQALQEHTGAVGAKLYYPGGSSIQHVGVINVGMGPSHALLGKADTEVYYYGRNRLDYNCLAVTAACLMVETARFRQVKGFDEALAVAFNDVDLCMKLQEAGYDNVIRNDVCLIHHESASRGLDFRDEKKMRRLIGERARLWTKHPQFAGGIDPYYSVNLASDRTDFVCKLSGNTLLPAKMAGTLKHPQRYESPFQVHIDEVVWDGDCIVRGWYYWKSDRAMADVRACLALLRDNGEVVCYEICKVERRDVAEALGVEWQECGFSCRLGGDVRSLIEGSKKIGILLKTGYGRKKLCWSDDLSMKETER